MNRDWCWWLMWKGSFLVVPLCQIKNGDRSNFRQRFSSWHDYNLPIEIKYATGLLKRCFIHPPIQHWLTPIHVLQQNFAPLVLLILVTVQQLNHAIFAVLRSCTFYSVPFSDPNIHGWISSWNFFGFHPEYFWIFPDFFGFLAYLHFLRPYPVLTLISAAAHFSCPQSARWRAAYQSPQLPKPGFPTRRPTSVKRTTKLEIVPHPRK